MTSASPISTIPVPLDAAVDSDRTELFDVAASLAQLPDAALVFLTAFVLYYFVNWKYLSQLWPMG